MQMTKIKRILSLIVCIVLITATALLTTACGDETPNTPLGLDDTTTQSAKPIERGKGETSFNFTVTDADGKDTAFLIHTDKKTVGDALIELGLIEGDEGQYGLYVKTVNDMTYDYDTDKLYWAFYADGKLAPAGVDMTDIVEGVDYAFKVEK